MLVTAPLGAAGETRPTLVIGTSSAPPYHDQNGTGFFDQVVAEAFRRAGLGLEIIDVPAERGLLNANAGIDDGDLSRIGGLERLYPNLRPVPEKLFEQEYVALTRRVHLETDRWDRLNPFTVAHIKGWKIFENDAYRPAELVRVENLPQLLMMLGRDRIDIALIERWMGLAEGRRQQIHDLRALEPPLARREIFLYLHKKHEPLLPRIAEALRELKTDGTHERLFRDLILEQTR
ncbi:MAG: ABC transporter substrate-binding protein [Gammaproteobacteria bacterium]|nr:ABC transporter substrate-binding protein [Gammaproteobacteria bacterium]